MKTFMKAVEEFIEASPWLEAKHQPAIVMLYAMANQLDDQVMTGSLHAPLLSQFGLAFRNLAKEAPKVSGEKDELEELLKDMKND